MAMSTRESIIRWRQEVYDEMRWEFEAMGEGGRCCQRQKDCAFNLIEEYGVGAVARILGLPRRTLQNVATPKGRGRRNRVLWHNTRGCDSVRRHRIAAHTPKGSRTPVSRMRT